MVAAVPLVLTPPAAAAADAAAAAVIVVVGSGGGGPLCPPVLYTRYSYVLMHRICLCHLHDYLMPAHLTIPFIVLVVGGGGSASGGSANVSCLCL
jgi:hypothetical protein